MTQDPRDQQISLGNQAVILYARGDLDGAMALLKEEERICRQLGDPANLARSLANQALLLGLTMGRPRAALPLAEEAFRMASQNNLTELAEQIRPFLDRWRREE
jgi:Flp pilus assembly protein TadD